MYAPSERVPLDPSNSRLVARMTKLSGFNYSGLFYDAYRWWFGSSSVSEARSDCRSFQDGDGCSYYALAYCQMQPRTGWCIVTE